MEKEEIGKVIARVRKSKGVSQSTLGVMVGVKQNMISKIESAGLALGVQIGDVAKISEALGEPGILVAYCQGCPARPYSFPDSPPADPAAALDKLHDAFMDAGAVASDLSAKLAKPGFQASAEFAAGLDQVRNIKRGIEALEQELLFSGCLTGCAR